MHPIVRAIEDGETYGAQLDGFYLQGVAVDFVFVARTRLLPYNPFDRATEPEKHAAFEASEARRSPYTLRYCAMPDDSTDPEEDFRVVALRQFETLETLLEALRAVHAIEINALRHLGDVLSAPG